LSAVLLRAALALSLRFLRFNRVTDMAFVLNDGKNKHPFAQCKAKKWVTILSVFTQYWGNFENRTPCEKLVTSK
jgi:hypothetical protein